MASSNFSRFEDSIQRLVEGGFARLFAGRLHPREVAVGLARAMEDYSLLTDSGDQIAPDTYLVLLHPSDQHALLAANSRLASTLAEELVEMARGAGLELAQPPSVRLLANDRVAEHSVIVRALHAAAKSDTTQALSHNGSAYPDSAAPEAALIVDDRHIPISRPLINLGRHRDNDIILESGQVSRHHAQIRLRFGRYVVFDLGSRAGTTVNGVSIKEMPLKSGDVIGLASHRVIYVEEPASLTDEDDEDHTRPYDDSLYQSED